MKTWSSLPSEIKFLVAIYVFQGAELTLPSEELQSRWSSQFDIFLVSKSFVDQKQLRKALFTSATLVSTGSNHLQDFQRRLGEDVHYVRRLRIKIVRSLPIQWALQAGATPYIVRDQQGYSVLTLDIILRTFPNLSALEIRFAGPLPLDNTLNEILVALRQPYLDDNLLFMGGLVTKNLDEQNTEIRNFLEEFIAQGVCYQLDQDPDLPQQQNPPQAYQTPVQSSEKLLKHRVIPSWLLYIILAAKSTHQHLDLTMSQDCMFVGGVCKTLSMNLQNYELHIAHENEEYKVLQRGFQELVEAELQKFPHADCEAQNQQALGAAT